MHISIDRVSLPSSVVFPWVFESGGKPGRVYVEALLAYYQLDKFKHWPGAWPNFFGFLEFHLIKGRRACWWVLLPTVAPVEAQWHPLAMEISKETLDAFKRSG